MKSGMRLRQVLVVDDCDADLLYTQLMLESAEVTDSVKTCGTARDALGYLQRPESSQVDVILLDINMPEMNGFEFLERYQALHVLHRAHAIVMMLSSSASLLDRERCETFSCVRGYVIKPIDTESARALLRIAMEVVSEHQTAS